VTEIADLKASSAANNTASPDGAPGRHDRDQVNDIARELMGKMRREWQGTAVDGGPWRNAAKGFAVSFVNATEVLITGTDATLLFPPNRKVKISHAAGNPVYCFVKTATLNAGNTEIVVEDFDDASPDDAVRAGANKIEFYASFGGSALRELGRAAFEDGHTGFEVPYEFTGAAINAAFARSGAGDKTVLLRAGTYTIETPIVMGSGASLVGLGPNRSQLRAATAPALDGDMIQINALAVDVSLKGFRLRGESASQSAGNGISIGSTVALVRIENLLSRISGATGSWGREPVRDRMCQ